ncbi:MAG: hypothetical protein JXN59_09430 [Anaerolineae bacterium]|nr:hypothetical protein [Anaerolineae bacterium]
MRQNEESRANALDEIRAVMSRRQEQHARLEQLLETFTSRLYEGFEQALTMARQAGVESINQVRYINHPAGGWRRALQIGIDDWRIVIVPLAGAAWPNANDEAMIPGVAFKEPSARLAFFLMQADDPQSSAFYDVIILLDGAWFAWGYGWPKQQDDLEHTDFTALALDLLASFVKDIHLTWATRDGTTLANAMDARRRVWRFGLPGQDEGPVRR